MIFPKNQELTLYTTIEQTHSGSSGIDRSLHKIWNIPLKGATTKRELISVSQVVYYLSGVLCLPSDFVFRYLPHKKPDFGTPKMEKPLFVGQNKIQPPWRFSPSHGPRTCLIWPRVDKLCMIRAKPSSPDLKSIQPRTW
jgi:hypothetical protein